jgi:uncharacterized repeat protein (TIGR02543 family)
VFGENGTPVTTNTTLYLKWILTYTITFNPNGGTVNMFIETFENGTNGWVLANGSQANKWVIDSATSNTGSYSAYISNNGSANSYNPTSPSVVHLYKDITFPSGNNQDFVLTFQFKGNGEEGSDYMTVGHSTTSSTPTAGSTFSSGTSLGASYFNNSNWTRKTITIPYATFGGQTRRLVFTWRNDGSVGTQPPAAIDDINISGGVATGITGEGGMLASLPTPIRTYYTFNGWFKTSTGGTPITTSTPFGENTTLYAQWTPNRYRVTFNASGGTVTPAFDTTGINWRLASLPTPTRSNYIFDSWYTAATSGTKVTTSTTFNRDTTIYAQWIPIYTVTFNANGGTVTPDSGTTGAGRMLASLPTPTRTGCTFNGWFTTLTGSTRVTTSTVFSANTTIYARWTFNTYTVTFNANGGTVTPTSGTTGGGWTLVSLPTPTRSGYAFSGWFTATTGGTQVTTSTVFSTNTTIYAQWTLNKYAVTFDANGGTVTPEADTTGVGWMLTSLPVPIRSGYTFNGWFTATTGGTQVTTSRVYSANTTIYARWTLNTYTITFDPNGGTLPGDGTSPETFENGTNGWVLVNGAQTNKWVIGSATSRAGSYSAYISNNGSANSYTVTSSSVVHLYKDVTFPTSSSNFTLTFYFKGNGESNYDNMTVRYSTTSSTPVAGSIFSAGTFLGTYYNNSSWTQKTITLPAATFSGKTMRLVFSWINDGSGGTQPPAAIDDISIPGIISTTFGTTGEGWTLVSLPVPTRIGYTFNGWFTATTGGAQVTANTVFSANTTVYARWTATVTSVSAEAQTTVKLYPNPVNNGQLIIENGQWQAGEAVKVYSISGALVATYNTTGEKTSVNVGHLPNGTYVLKVGGYTAKFVKQ